MPLKPEVSIPVALATGTMVYAIYSNTTPSIADIRTADQFNADVASSRKQAAWTAAAVVAGISLITKDPNPFILGGALIIGMDWAHRHADMVNPLTGRAVAADLTMSDIVPATTQEANPGSYGYADDVAVA